MENSGSNHVRAGRRPLDLIVKLADDIWLKVRSSGIPIGETLGRDRLLEKLRKEFPDFAKSYPLPFKWMVCTGEYSSRAFSIYLRHHVKEMYKDRQEFLDSQAEYLVILRKTHNPDATAKYLQSYRKTIIEHLREDDEAFEDAWKKAKKQVEEDSADRDMQRRKHLIQYLSKQ